VAIAQIPINRLVGTILTNHFLTVKKNAELAMNNDKIRRALKACKDAAGVFY